MYVCMYVYMNGFAPTANAAPLDPVPTTGI